MVCGAVYLVLIGTSLGLLVWSLYEWPLVPQDWEYLAIEIGVSIVLAIEVIGRLYL
jgi:hypothetical protein